MLKSAVMLVPSNGIVKFAGPRLDERLGARLLTMPVGLAAIHISKWSTPCGGQNPLSFIFGATFVPAGGRGDSNGTGNSPDAPTSKQPRSANGLALPCSSKSCT